MRRFCMIAVALGVALALPSAAHAADFTVDTPTEAALHAAVDAANAAEGPDRVLLGGHTIVLNEIDLDVEDDLTIRGPGTIDGSGLEGDGIIDAFAALALEDVRIINSDGRAVTIWVPSEARVERSQFAGNDGAISFRPQIESISAKALAENSLTVTDSTFEDNVADTGGAIDVEPGGQIPTAVTVARSTFAGNRAISDGESTARGGAINVWNGMLTVENSTFSGNLVQGSLYNGSGGGAIAVNGSSSATLTHVTIAGNRAEGGARGGGLSGPFFDVLSMRGARSFVPLSVANSILAGNTSEMIDGDARAAAALAAQTDDCDFAVGSLGGNLEGGTTCNLRGTGDKQNADPMLAALAANGGPTRTQAIAAGSPARDAALAGRCATTDQRGIVRVPAACDSGAYEYVPPGVQPTTQQPPAAGGALGEEASSCLSVRRFKIRLRVPRGEEVRKATVVLNGEKIKVKRGKRLTAIIDLRGLEKKRYKVKITLHLKGGGKVSGVRRYWTCTPAIRWTKPPKV